MTEQDRRVKTWPLLLLFGLYTRNERGRRIVCRSLLVRTLEFLREVGPPAEVHRDGVRLGQTPYVLHSYVGEPVRLVLRRDGAERPVAFVTPISDPGYLFDLPNP